jgi:hypothetical protein
VKLKRNERRFLIIWVCVHAFALFVNVAKVKGTIKEADSLFNKDAYYEYLFTSSVDNDDFWPFTTYYEKVNKPATDTVAAYNITYFNGVFTSYGIIEFISYCILGFAIVYVPKFWKA